MNTYRVTATVNDNQVIDEVETDGENKAWGIFISRHPRAHDGLIEELPTRAELFATIANYETARQEDATRIDALIEERNKIEVDRHDAWREIQRLREALDTQLIDVDITANQIIHETSSIPSQLRLSEGEMLAIRSFHKKLMTKLYERRAARALEEVTG